jgi:tungstate transport system substrate-binding protein
MKKFIFLPLIMIFLTISSLGHGQGQRLRLASTTSTDNTGLFRALNPPFEKMFHCRVDVLAQGTGKALKTGQMGDCDVVFVHSRPAEVKFVQEGYGVNRRDVMYNEFVVLGPTKDPAQITGLTDVAEAFRKIATKKSPFISRGDDSGTHKREKAIWKKAGIMPEDRWYVESGLGMGAVLQIANEKQAYTLCDRGTYIAYAKKNDLEVLAAGDPVLFNPYGIIAVNPAKHPKVNYLLAMAYIGWVTSPEGQKIIREFGKDQFGESLFVPLAVP